MVDQRRKAYLRLIYALLTCPSDERKNVLQANPNLMDYGLVQTMEGEASYWEEQGNLDIALLLRTFLIPVVRLSVTSKQVLPFLYQVLQATQDNPDEVRPRVVYPILEENLDKLDDNFAEVLRYWANGRLSAAEPDEAVAIALTIDLFSDLMRVFPKGDRASNLEIAIAGYEIASSVYTQNDLTQAWANANWTLGVAYRNRLRDDWQENVEKAIACYNNALQFYNEDYPKEWAGIQSDLGVAYAFRICGDNQNPQNQEIPQQTKDLIYQQRLQGASLANIARLTDGYGVWLQTDVLLENLKQAIACFQDALQVFNRDAFPKEWGRVQYNLGRAYDDLREVGQNYEEWAENSEKAIECYENALQIFTSEAEPEQLRNELYNLRIVFQNLGIAYNERPQGDPAENQERAIECYNPLLSLSGYSE